MRLNEGKNKWLYKLVWKIEYSSIFLKDIEEMSISTAVGMLHILFQINSQNKQMNTMNRSHYYIYYCQPNTTLIHNIITTWN